MEKRFVSIWFRYLLTDWQTLRRPELKNVPFVFTGKDGARLIVKAANPIAIQEGVTAGMPAADAKAIVAGLQLLDERPALTGKLLAAIGEWCIRFTPIVMVDMPDGLLMDVSGCAHLWGGEPPYLKEIVTRLRAAGYDTRIGIASTPGAAWAVARFGKNGPIVPPGKQLEALLPLPTAALRIEPQVQLRLHKMGFWQIGSFIHMDRRMLFRRYGIGLLDRIEQALGFKEEVLTPIQVIPPYQERLPCLEPIRNAAGIEIAIGQLLESLCKRLHSEGKGVRAAKVSCHRVDGQVESIEIGTTSASGNVAHLLGLFRLKISSIAPGLGIELFVLDSKVENATQEQHALWGGGTGVGHAAVNELLDRIAGKIGPGVIHRYLPDAHHWPERSIRKAQSITEQPAMAWRTDIQRPVQLLADPENITVSAPIPDYPPMNFIHKGVLHEISKAEGPERIEQEWWLENGEHRDYYVVEDREGRRYWLFRSGHYGEKARFNWYLHGYFA